VAPSRHGRLLEVPDRLSGSDRTRRVREEVTERAQSFAGPDGIELPAVSVVASASSRSLAHDALQARGAPEPVESPVECLVERSRAAHAWLQVERLDDERSLAPLGLQIRAPDDPVAPEEGQDVVAVAALRRRSPGPSRRADGAPAAKSSARSAT
jgi:hypothetical protein